ncbi:hypothetical protein [Streptosporangium sp. NPDC023615]|uniref:hypothetical protein n=1 Tax=Streptosporangium sp. NPDC023615 TaxID=3154794 RepID=UPI003413D017
MLQRATVALLVAGGATWATAASSARPAPDPDFSLTVSPARLVVGPEEIDAGHSFHVINRGRSPVEVRVGGTDLTTDESGGAALRRDAPRSAAGWLTVRPSRFRLAPGAERSVTVLIDPPARAESGGHQAALLFVVPTRDTEGDVLLNRAIGTPLYITVPGPADTSVRIAGLTTPRAFTTGGPVDFTVALDNLGTAHRDLSGPDRLRLRVNGEDVPFPDLVLPRGTSATATVRWADPPPACVCRATVSIAGTPGTSRASVMLLVLPLRPLAALSASAPILYVVVRRLRRRYRTRAGAPPGRAGGGGQDHGASRTNR